MNKPSQKTTTGMSGPAAIVIAALIGVIGLVLGAFLTPLGQRTFAPNEPEVSLPTPLTANTQASGCGMLGDAQVCWGQIPTLPIGPKGQSQVRNFSFPFAKPFKSIPSVTYGINVVGPGFTFSVYNASVTEAAYTGSLAERLGRKTEVPVAMSYTAIGQPK